MDRNKESTISSAPNSANSKKTSIKDSNNADSSLFVIGQTQKEQLKKAFDLFATDGGGTIKMRELNVVMKSLGFDLSRDELAKLMPLKPNETVNKNSGIDFNEFLQIITRQIGNKSTGRCQELERAFKLFDHNQRGKISFEDLKKVADELGENLTDQEIQEMIDEADIDGDGFVSKEEFMELMKKAQLF